MPCCPDGSFVHQSTAHFVPEFAHALVGHEAIQDVEDIADVVGRHGGLKKKIACHVVIPEPDTRIIMFQHGIHVPWKQIKNAGDRMCIESDFITTRRVRTKPARLIVRQAYLQGVQAGPGAHVDAVGHNGWQHVGGLVDGPAEVLHLCPHIRWIFDVDHVIVVYADVVVDVSIEITGIGQVAVIDAIPVGLVAVAPVVLAVVAFQDVTVEAFDADVDAVIGYGCLVNAVKPDA